MNKTTRPWRSFFDTNSLIPSDINKIKQFTSNIVLYNNNICVTKNITVESNFSELTKQLRVKVTCDVPFKFYLYYTTEIKSTLVPTLLKRTFHDKIQNNKKKVAELENQINTAFNDIELLKAKDIEKRQRQTELRTLLTDLNIQIKNLIQTLNNSTDSFRDELNLQQKYLTSIRDTDLYSIGSKIQKIFNKNKLKSSINDQIVVINKFIEEELLKTKTYRENFVTLSHKQSDKV